MQKNYLYIGLFFLILMLLSAGYLLTSQKKPTPKKTNEIVLYYGETCPHCKIVDEFLSKNKNIEAKIKIVKKEVYNDRQNASDMNDKAEICGLDTSLGLGVPFLYYQGTCVNGDTPIINYLTEKAK